MKDRFLILSGWMLATFIFLSVTTFALGVKPVERPQTILPEQREASVLLNSMRVDAETGQPLALYGIDYAVIPGPAEEMARQYLRENAELLHLQDPELGDLIHHRTRESRAGTTVRFRQQVDGIPVYQSEITVSIDSRNRVVFVMNGYKPFVRVPTTAPSLAAEEARQIAIDHLDVQGDLRFEDISLVIYPAGDFSLLVYRVETVPRVSPTGDWEILIDAQSGEIVQAVDTAHYVDGTGYVFDPDPLSTSGASYGDPGYTDNDDANSPELDAELMNRILPDIDLTAGTYTLIGPWAEIVDSEAPFNGLFGQGSSAFEFNRQQDGFEAVDCYYHIDLYMWYVNNILGVSITPFQYPGGVRFDPHGLNGADNSHYVPATGEIAFGEGGVDDAEDADIIIHELGHALHHWVTSGSLSQVDGLSEGIGDYSAQSYSRAFGHWLPTDPEYHWVFNWDGHNPFWVGRDTNSPDHYPEDLTGDVYHDGAIWSTCVMRIWDAIGRERSDLALWEGIGMTNSTSNQQDAANAVVQAAISMNYNPSEMCALIENFQQTGYQIAGVGGLRAIQLTRTASRDNTPTGIGLEQAVFDTVWFGGHDGMGYAVEGDIWDFDDETMQGWFGIDVAVHPLTLYNNIPCDCGLEGHVLAFHDQNLEQRSGPNMAASPIVDRTMYPASSGFNNVLYEWDIYAWLPLNNGVLYRPGAMFYPTQDSGTDDREWSWRVGKDVWHYTGSSPVCFTELRNLTTHGVPGNADLYRLVIEITSCCSCFGVEDCTGLTNETPLFDNIRFGLTVGPDAPVIALDTWRLQDIFPEDGKLSATSTGRCDDPIVKTGTKAPFIMGDSLGIAGPVVGSDTDPWEAHFWFRIERKGAGQDAVGAYGDWISDLAGHGNPESDFVSVKMDSSEIGANALTNKFCTFAHPDNEYYTGDPEADERSDLNEIIRDNVIAPGTKIQYFITANFIGNATKFFLPDTSNQTFFDYEILPSMRLDPASQAYVWPCVLYWDAYNRGAEDFIQPALDALLPDVPGDGPNNDRYDMWGASSNFAGSSIYRLGVGANNGGTLAQLLGYRTIILNTGDFSPGAMEESDVIGVEDWLLTTICGSGSVRHGFIANGDEVAGVIEALRPSFLTGALGVALDCSPYRDPGCPFASDPDPSYCVEINNMGGPYDHNPDDPTDTYYTFGSGCPNLFAYSVLFATDGVGNRLWRDYDGFPYNPGSPTGKGEVEWAQVVNDQGGGPRNYRSIIDGYSYHHITETNNDLPFGDCEGDEDGRIQAAGKEVIAALKWIFDAVDETELPGFCSDPCPDPSGAPDVGTQAEVLVNRLFQNQPNPFNPRTAVHFSVAARGPVELNIYDVGGRLVKTLVDKPMDAGLHSVIWDGTDNGGHRVGSGIYWSQLDVGDYVSSKKVVVLK